MWQGGWPCWGRHRCPAQYSQQECHRLALHCTHRESTATTGTGQGLGCAQGKELERMARAGNPGAAHFTSKAVPPGRQPHSPKQGAENIILPVLWKKRYHWMLPYLYCKRNHRAKYSTGGPKHRKRCWNIRHYFSKNIKPLVLGLYYIRDKKGWILFM